VTSVKQNYRRAVEFLDSNIHTTILYYLKEQRLIPVRGKDFSSNPTLLSLVQPSCNSTRYGVNFLQ